MSTSTCRPPGTPTVKRSASTGQHPNARGAGARYRWPGRARTVPRVDTLGEDLLLLALLAGHGSLRRDYGISFALMGAELVQLAALGRVGVTDDNITVESTEPAGDTELDAALTALAGEPGPLRTGEWVARPQEGLPGGYLARLAAAGVISPAGRFYRRWRFTDPARVAAARQRLDAIARSAGPIGLGEAAYAGLACAAGLDRRLYPDRAGRAQRRRLLEIAQGGGTAGPAGGGPADPAQAAGQAAAAAAAAPASAEGAAEVSAAAGSAAVQAASQAAAHAAVHSATHAVAHAAGSAAHGSHGGGGGWADHLGHHG